jgi:hypothetical protein
VPDWLQPLVATPTDDVAPNATVTVTSGAANTEYPAANLVNRNPAKPGKSTSAAITYRFTWSGNQIIRAIAIINHNLDGATVTLSNAAGVNQVLTIPDNTPGIYPTCINPWRDLADDWSTAQRTDDIWDLAITGGALGNIAVGEVCFLTDLQPLNLVWGAKLSPRWMQVSHRTFGGSLLRYNKRVLINGAVGRVDLDEDRDLMVQIDQESNGSIVPFVFIPHEDVNEAWYVQARPESFALAYTNPQVTEMPFEVEEVSEGPPLFP